MHYFKLLLTTFLFSSSIAAQNTTEQNDTFGVENQIADTIIYGGPIYTANDAQPRSEALAIKNGKFIYVGSRFGVEQHSGDSTKVIDLDGVALYPGFSDAHAHLSGIGNRELSLNLENINSIKALKIAIKAWHTNHPDTPIIIGRGWIETHWPDKRFPTRWDIDDVISDIPVILKRADGHALVANTKALETANINSLTTAPFGGAIIRNKLGEITGVLIDAAQTLIAPLVPIVTEEITIEQLVKGGEVYAKRGWTSIHNMSVSWRDTELLQQLSDAGDINIRVYNSIVPGDAQKLFFSGPQASANNKVITRAIKLFMDGALGSRGAALLAPYSDANTSGLLLSKKEDVLPILTEALREGIQVNMHAIGDKANRMLLDWYEEAFTLVPNEGRAIQSPRWRDEHAQILNSADINRYQQLGIIPSMQPSHAIGDMHFAPGRLGDDRLHGAYAWNSLINSGVIIAGGSDAPVEVGSPLIEFYAAISRKDLAGFQGENWRPEEAISRENALKMFTLWPAIASFQEETLGSIIVGKEADLTAFNIDIMTADENEIPKAEAVMTMVGGEIIYLKE